MRGGKPAIAVIFALAFAACGPDAVTGGTGGGDASPTWGTSDCGSCVEVECSTEWTGCYEDPGCAQYLDCLRGCAVVDGDVDPNCEASCPVPESSTAQDAIKLLTYCREQGPGAATCDACGRGELCSPDLDQTCSASTETNTCWKCQDEQCCDTDQRCRDNPACLDLFDCLQSCTADDCFAICYAQHPAGVEDLGAKLGCILVNCPEECAGATDACSQCLNSACRCEGYACSTDAPCTLLQECRANCGNDQACWEGCAMEFPEGEELIDQQGLCGFAMCEAECAEI